MTTHLWAAEHTIVHRNPWLSPWAKVRKDVSWFLFNFWILLCGELPPIHAVATVSGHQRVSKSGEGIVEPPHCQHIVVSWTNLHQMSGHHHHHHCHNYHHKHHHHLRSWKPETDHRRPHKSCCQSQSWWSSGCNCPRRWAGEDFQARAKSRLEQTSASCVPFNLVFPFCRIFWNESRIWAFFWKSIFCLKLFIALICMKSQNDPFFFFYFKIPNGCWYILRVSLTSWFKACFVFCKVFVKIVDWISNVFPA